MVLKKLWWGLRTRCYLVRGHAKRCACTSFAMLMLLRAEARRNVKALIPPTYISAMEIVTSFLGVNYSANV